ncbi:MAG: ABC transporter permease [Deltaproteobacteria bacterium]|nr:ABC transporter permease [Deltaproteobacteria bacterium]
MWFLAIRHLLSKPRQTALTLAGITLGTAAYVAISGMMLGFQTYIIDQLVNNDAQIRVTAREDIVTLHSLDDAFFPAASHIFWEVPPAGRRDYAYIEYPAGWFERLDRDVRVAAYSPQLVTQMLAARGRISVSTRFIGSEPERQARVSNIEKYMLVGHFRDIGSTGNRVVVGDGLLNKLGTRVSENLLISSGKGQPVPFKIVGSFHLGVKSLDDTTIFGALSDVQKAYGTPSRVSDIAIRLTDVSQARTVADEWALLSQEKVQSWDEANEGIMSVFKTQNVMRYSMTVSILVVAGFGIYNILSMAVQQKRREIAILRSIGYEPSDILWLFQLQGMLLGAAGGLLGLLIGYELCTLMSHIQVSPQRGLGNGMMMVSFDAFIYARAFLISFGVAALAGVLPSRAAGKLTPIDIIRTEGS